MDKLNEFEYEHRMLAGSASPDMLPDAYWYDFWCTFVDMAGVQFGMNVNECTQYLRALKFREAGHANESPIHHLRPSPHRILR